MTQIKNDKLLGIHERHQITCPIINTLIFVGENMTKNYYIGISQNPAKLEVYPYDLIEAIDDLNKWSRDVIRLYENLPQETKDQHAHLEIELMIEEIQELISYDTDLSNDENYINKIINDWTVLHNQYQENQDKIENLRDEVFNLDDRIEELNSDSFECLKLKEERSTLNSQLSKLETLELLLEKTFENDIHDLFEANVYDYSRKLEIIRARNDNLRVNTHGLMLCLIMNIKNEFDVEQPDDYLNRMFQQSDLLSRNKIVNIGLLYNNTPFYGMDEDDYDLNEDGKKYFMKLCDSLISKGFLKYSDKAEFDLLINPVLIMRDDYLKKFGFPKSESKTPEFQKKILFDKLSQYGFSHVRYYENIDDYKENKDNFKLTELKNCTLDVKNLRKIKPI